MKKLKELSWLQNKQPVLFIEHLHTNMYKYTVKFALWTQKGKVIACYNTRNSQLRVLGCWIYQKTQRNKIKITTYKKIVDKCKQFLLTI